MQVEVNLLLLDAGRPLRRDVVRGVLDAEDPFPVDHDTVPPAVAVHGATEQARPETALGLDIRGVEHDDPPDDLHVGIFRRRTNHRKDRLYSPSSAG